MNIDLTEDQQMIKELAAKFAQEQLKPQAAKFEEDEEIPKEILQELGSLGFMGMMVPEDLGGAGLDAVSYVVAIEEIKIGLRVKVEFRKLYDVGRAGVICYGYKFVPDF